MGDKIRHRSLLIPIQTRINSISAADKYVKIGKLQKPETNDNQTPKNIKEKRLHYTRRPAFRRFVTTSPRLELDVLGEL